MAEAPVRNYHTKEKVRAAAVRLFNRFGYNGTSVRAIAQEAGVNPSLISYYFGSKNELLEHLMSYYLENYIKVIENSVRAISHNLNLPAHLKKLVSDLIDYQNSEAPLAHFVYREMTLDTSLNGELMATYLMKEKYLYQMIFDYYSEDHALGPSSLEFVILQFREMVIFPFSQPQYIRKIHYLYPKDPAFIGRYKAFIYEWLDSTIGKRPADLTAD